MLGLPADKPIKHQEGYVDPRMRQDPSGLGWISATSCIRTSCHVGDGVWDAGAEKAKEESLKISVEWSPFEVASNLR